jgi:uracil-DNA glycosylase
MMKKLLLIGPALGRIPGEPLAGRNGRRLAKLAGITPEEYLKRTERMNLLPYWPGRHGEGDLMPRRMLAGAAFAMLHELEDRRVVMLGSSVAWAFRVHRVPLFRWFEFKGALVMVMPHPSGRNRWWNDPAHVARARRALRQLFKENGCGVPTGKWYF